MLAAPGIRPRLDRRWTFPYCGSHEALDKILSMVSGGYLFIDCLVPALSYAYQRVQPPGAFVQLALSPIHPDDSLVLQATGRKTIMEREKTKVAVLFSGGTDSTASAAILAESFEEIHLLTYDRHGFYNADNSVNNARRLADRFPHVRFIHRIYETTPLAKWIANHKRWRYIRKYGFFTLQNCGHCALANHIGTLGYCLRHGIDNLADGITYDWPFFPGHMDKVIAELKIFHRKFGITYHTPVLHFDVEEPPHYIEKISPDFHKANTGAAANTTGKLLFKLGLSETTNYKGSETDRRVQARCYQFAVPNMFIYWVFRGVERWDDYEKIVHAYFSELLDDSKILIEEYLNGETEPSLFSYLDEDRGDEGVMEPADKRGC
jgi:hypothetical protein